MLSIKVPPLGESIVEATVSRWLKKEGDVVAAGDTLVDLETDKITVEVPALKPGALLVARARARALVAPTGRLASARPLAAAHALGGAAAAARRLDRV